MSASITVIFHIDLTRVPSYAESEAIQAVQKKLRDNQLPNASMSMNFVSNLVIPLPEHKSTLGLLLSLCDSYKIPYKTLWLNDSAEWQ